MCWSLYSALSEPPTEASAQARLQVLERAIAALTRNLPAPGPPGSPDPPGPQGTTAGNNGANGWRIEDLGYFNPDLSDPDLSDPADAYRTIQDHTYHHDIYVFVERLKDLQAIKGEDLVRNKSPRQCSRL